MPFVQRWFPASAEYQGRQSLITRTILTLFVLLYGSCCPHLAHSLLPRRLGITNSPAPYLGSFVGGNKVPGYETTYRHRNFPRFLEEKEQL